ncbi:MAG: right-handed parallel beta-helix repeat-containing protein, partial [Clostridia bacterium]|nr:right-handed parallel beta-helix repeat-containing protein [Clostridia bacterium]
DDNPVTVASYGDSDEKPVVEYGGGDVVAFSKCSNLVIRDLEVSSTVGDRPSDGFGNQSTVLHGIYDTVGNNKYRNIWIVNNTVHSSTDRSQAFGIAVNSIEDRFSNCPSDVLQNVHIENNTVYNVGRSGIHMHGWLSNEKSGNQNNGLHTLYRDVHIDNNVVHNVGCIGIYVGCVTGSTMNRNLVYNTGMCPRPKKNGQFVESEGDCGIMAISVDDCKVMYNVTYNNFDDGSVYDAMGIDIDWNSKNCVVQYNHTYDCDGGGIGTMANLDGAILNNRIENNRTNTNQPGQISVSDFTSRYDAVDPSMHVVKNLRVEENLIVAAPNTRSKYMFSARDAKGDSDNWSGNVFSGNHLVYTADDADLYWIGVTGVSWYKFADNRFYAADTSSFRAIDGTPESNINIA